MDSIIVTDLGYGDSGKGTLIDALARRYDADLVVRHNGGPQAAHNVVTPAGRHHTFAQIGSGGFLPGLRTLLSRFTLIEPYAFFNEAAHLAGLTGWDPLQHVYVDRRALLITPYQQMANRLREAARGDAAHGTCGMGVGETVGDALRDESWVLRAGDLDADPAALRRALTRIRAAKRAELESAGIDPGTLPEFDDPEVIDAAADVYAALAQRVTLLDADESRRLLRGSRGPLLFEGAQGVLLDEDHGFAPHVTWSRTTGVNARALLADAGLSGGAVRHLGVLRAYMTRHGLGPFVSEAAALRPHLPEPHNDADGWQGAFRVGWPDLVAARYAARVAGVDALAVTHLDRAAVLDRIVTAYTCPPMPDDAHFFMRQNARDGAGRVRDIRPYAGTESGRWASRWQWQCALTARLKDCQPLLTPMGTASSADAALMESLTQALQTPMAVGSWGPTARDKRWYADW